MGANKASGWVAGTAVLVLAILAAVYLLVASPRLDAAEETRLQADTVRSENELLEIETDKLRADFANLKAYRAEVLALQLQIPPTGQLAAYVRTIDAAATANSVFLAEITPGVASAVIPPIPAPVAAPATPAPVEGEVPTETPAPEGGVVEPAPAPAAPAAPLPIDGFVLVPFTMKVIGTYENTMALVHQLQVGTDRLYLVTNLDMKRAEPAEATGGKPAVVLGDLETLISGQIYVLKPPAGSLVVPEEDGPVPTSPTNPFTPIPGTEPKDTASA